MAGKTCGTSGIAHLEVDQRSMSKTIIIIDTSEVKEGKLEDLKAAMNDLVEFTKMNEPNMIAYDVYFNDDGTQMTVLQVHPDSASAEFHMKILGSRFSRFVEFVKMSGIDIYGKPSQDSLERLRLKSQMLGSETVVVHELHTGFDRF